MDTRTDREMMQGIEAKMDVLIDIFKGNPETTTEPEPRERMQFFKKHHNDMLVIGITLFFAALSLFTYRYNLLQFFPITFGFLFAFLIFDSVWFIFDRFIPGETFDEIAKNPVAISIALFCFYYAVVSGVSVGASFITDPLEQRTTISIPAGADYNQSLDAGTLDTGNSGQGSAGNPEWVKPQSED